MCFRGAVAVKPIFVDKFNFEGKRKIFVIAFFILPMTGRFFRNTCLPSEIVKAKKDFFIKNA